MSDTRTTLHAKVREATEAQKNLEYKIKQLAREAARAVEKSFDAELNAHYRAIGEAQSALQACIDAEAAHEWEGQKVYRMVDKSSRWATKPCMVPVFGIVEVRRSGTEFPAGQRYGLPEQGEAFVRMLKKDGTPGLQLDRWHWRVTDGWQLVANMPKKADA